MVEAIHRYFHKRRIMRLMQEAHIALEDYEINQHNQVSIHGDITIISNMIKNNALIIHFKEVSGNFNARGLALISLIGSPHSVQGDFICSYNALDSLKGAPEVIGGNFDCSNNDLSTLRYGPKEVGANYTCEDNDLVSLDYLPQSVGGDMLLHMIELPPEPYAQVFQLHSYLWEYQGTLDRLISQH